MLVFFVEGLNRSLSEQWVPTSSKNNYVEFLEEELEIMTPLVYRMADHLLIDYVIHLKSQLKDDYENKTIYEYISIETIDIIIKILYQMITMNPKNSTWKIINNLLKEQNIYKELPPFKEQFISIVGNEYDIDIIEK